MSYSEILIKFIAGGSLIVLVSYFAKSKMPYISGLAVLFPVVTVVGYYFLSQVISPNEMKRVALASIYSIPATISFLLTVYITVNRMVIGKSIMYGIISWFLTACILIVFDRVFIHLIFK